ncbi:MAG: ZIP family metal transporter [Mollicutes bacterium]|nr:ZIP family metal transporter [Mollicutes bacterium]
MQSLLITLLVGLFFLAGALISLFVNNKKNLISFSLGISFVVLILLVILDILPECFELFPDYKFLAIGGGILVGIALLLILEKLVPHHHDHTEKDDHDHLTHIGVMTSIAIIIHNIVEGIGIGAIAESSFKSGIIYALGVALHNIPFGIKITALLKDNKKKLWINLGLLTLSTLIGGILVFIFKDMLSDFFLGTLLSITIGMIFYIICFELINELKENFNKYAIYGILTGILIMLLGLVI